MLASFSLAGGDDLLPTLKGEDSFFSSFSGSDCKCWHRSLWQVVMICYPHLRAKTPFGSSPIVVGNQADKPLIEQEETANNSML